MPSIQIKHVPAQIHETLRRRAASAGQSMQEYLLDLLSAEAEAPTLEEVLERAGHRTGGRADFASAAAAVRADRDAR